MSTNKILILIVAVALFFSVFGCGGGAGDTGDTEIPTGQKINGDLTGYIYVSEQYDGWLINLETGKALQSPQIGWFDTGEFTGSSPSLRGYPNQSNGGYLVAGRRCFSNENGSGYFDCIIKLDSMGSVIGQIQTLPRELREAKMSIDGNYIAITHADESYSNPSCKLIIYDSSIEIVSHATMNDVGPGGNADYYESGFDWMDNGQIVYAYKKSLYITGPYSAEGTAIVTLPESSYPETNIFPMPAEPRVSPDGSKVAFRYVTDSGLYSSEATIWVANIDGTDLHQLVHAKESAVYQQIFNYLDWSPDGKYIIVGEGGIGDDSITGGKGNRLYAIPSESRNIELDLFDCDNTGGVICVRTYFDSQHDLTYRFKPYSNVFEWIE